MLYLRRVRIALISTPFVPVPPPRYGGTELIVAELAEGFSTAGHEVTLFATGDSRLGVDVRALVAEAEWPPDPAVALKHAAWAADEILRDPRPFDVVHAHVPAVLPFARRLGAPMVYTIHHDRDEEQAVLYAQLKAHYVAISARQRQLLPEAEAATVIHHGLSPGRYRFGSGRGGYAVFLGRFAREKGVHLALEVAKAAGVPLRLGGRPHCGDQAYYQREVAPHLGAAQLVGEVGGGDKLRLLGEAAALLFPVCWEEPFGLVMIEAMLCGTPVIALRRGSVSEVVEDGITGFVCSSAQEMARRLRQIVRRGFNRRRCRARAVEKWSAHRMVREHLALYEQVRRWENADARSAAPGV